MNRKQLIVMWIAVGVLSFMFLVPPWQYYMRARNLRAPGPYHFIFLGRPEVPVTSVETWDRGTKTEERFRSYPRKFWKVDIDWVRLLIPSAVVSMISLGLIVSFRRPKVE